MSNYKLIKIERDGPIATLTLNRPGACNAMNYDIMVELEHCLLALRDDADSRVLIFTGAGKHFCAGADLEEFKDKGPQPKILRRRRLRMGERVMRALLNVDQITICAWNGGALGGGACLATGTDFRIGAEDSFIQYPEIDLGLNLMWQSLPRTVRMCGESRALRLVVGGERLMANTLLDWGMLESIAPNSELLERAREFAETYARKSPIAAQMIKRSVAAIGSHLDHAMMHMDTDQHLLAQMTDDHDEAVEAYLAKRDPRFVGN